MKGRCDQKKTKFCMVQVKVESQKREQETNGYVEEGL